MFTVDLKELAQALAFIKRAADVRMRGMQAETRVLRFRDDTAGVVSVTWFDYETEIAVTLPVRAVPGVSGGCFVADYEATLTAVKTLGAKGAATFGLESGGAVRIESADGVVSLATSNFGDLPALPDESRAALVLETTGEALHAAVGVVAAARGTDATLPMLTGVKLESDHAGVTLATTDRFRLATVWVPSEAEPAVASLEVLLPGKQFVEFAKQCKAHGRVEIRLDTGVGGSGRVVFQSETVRVVGRLLECDFPRWKQLLPKAEDAAAAITVDAQAIAKRLKSFAATARTVALTIAPSGVTVAARDVIAGSGSASFALPCEVERVDEEMVIGLSTQYLAELLAPAARGTDATLRFYKPSKPISIEWGDAQSMLMPVRLPEPAVA